MACARILCRISARSSQSQALLANIRECFDSVIPGLIATCDADGVPNMAYRSQVQFIDLEHVALAYPFFNKTRQNVLLKPKVRLLLTLPSAKKTATACLRLPLSSESRLDQAVLRRRVLARPARPRPRRARDSGSGTAPPSSPRTRKVSAAGSFR